MACTRCHTLYRLINQKQAVPAELAVRLEAAFGSTAMFFGRPAPPST